MSGVSDAVRGRQRHILLHHSAHLQEEVLYSNLRTPHHTEGDEEHVRDAMVHSHGNKGGDGEEDREELPLERLSAGGHVDGNGDEVAADYTADEGDGESLGDFGNGHVGSGRAGEGAGLEGKVGGEEGADEVPRVAHRPTLPEGLGCGKPLAVCRSNEHEVTRRQLCPRHEGHEEAHREAEGSEEDFLEPRVGGGEAWAGATDRDSKEGAEADLWSVEDEKTS